MGDFTLKICTVAAMAAFLCGTARSALIQPKNGQFDIVTDPGISFNNRLINITDSDIVTGDLAIRVANSSGQTITFEPCTVTLNFAQSTFNLYLPEFTFQSMDNIYFWVSDNGATYYANTAKSPGQYIDYGPNMSAAAAIAAGDEYLAAAVPEPATLALLGLGGMFLCRKRTA